MLFPENKPALAAWASEFVNKATALTEQLLHLTATPPAEPRLSLIERLARSAERA